MATLLNFETSNFELGTPIPPPLSLSPSLPLSLSPSLPLSLSPSLPLSLSPTQIKTVKKWFAVLAANVLSCWILPFMELDNQISF